VAQVTVAGNSSQINLVLDSRNVSFGFLLNSTSRTLTIGKQLEIPWPASVNYVVERLVIRCSPITLPSSKVSFLHQTAITNIALSTSPRWDGTTKCCRHCATTHRTCLSDQIKPFCL